jgi:hypothetical protein
VSLKQPRNCGKALRLSSLKGPDADIFKLLEHLAVEICIWGFRIYVLFTLDKSLYVTNVFEKKGFGVIFRMTLKEQEEALSLLDEAVIPGVKLRERLKAFGLELILGDPIVTRLRNIPALGGTLSQRMFDGVGALE